MRRGIAALLGAAALALPNANALAAATAGKAATKTKTVVATRSFAGATAYAGRWGDLRVTIVVRKTTTTNLRTKKTAVTRRITSVTVPVSPSHSDRSVFINEQALPILIQEAIQAQSAAVNVVSRATDSTEAFEQSLGSAIAAARAW